jgi:hypothetical protein
LCGAKLEKIETQYHSKFVDFFGKEVEIFSAEEDPSKTTLFRLSDLADLMKCDHSMVRH